MGKAVRAKFASRSQAASSSTASTIPHGFQLPARNSNAYLNEEGLDDIFAWRQLHAETQTAGRERYAKDAKSLLTTGGKNKFPTSPAGLAIEIVPELNPYDLKPGADLPIRILLRGNPAPNLKVDTSWAIAGAQTKTTIVGRTVSMAAEKTPPKPIGKALGPGARSNFLKVTHQSLTIIQAPQPILRMKSGSLCNN